MKNSEPEATIGKRRRSKIYSLYLLSPLFKKKNKKEGTENICLNIKGLIHADYSTLLQTHRNLPSNKIGCLHSQL